MNLEVIATWTEILRVVPDRLELRGWVPSSSDSLANYADVDIALDTYPFNGATTTFEALWMGVPVVTLRDQRHAGRVGASILTHLGRAEWIADDADVYVSVARQLASGLLALASIRRSLRGELQNSSLTDARGFARKIESVYRDIRLLAIRPR